MNGKLLSEALIKYLLGVVVVGITIFLPAGSFSWRNGWLFMAVLFLPMFIAGIVMYLKAPDLLRSRLNARESQSEQKQVISYSGVMFLAAFILAGLNKRFGWTVLPDWLVFTGAALFLLGYALFGEVLRENAYLSRTIEVQKGQKVVDTGLYGLVRHPMYSATLIMFLSMPFILGSWPSFLIMLSYIPIIVKRIKNEEEVLKQKLEGYDGYMKKVTWRLLPFIW